MQKMQPSGHKIRIELLTLEVNSVYSNWTKIRCGVPQGGVLGPLFFNTFINVLNFIITLSSLRLYADYTTNYAADSSPAVLEFISNKDLRTLSDWLIDNFLTLNIKKTQAMVIGGTKYSYDLVIEDETKTIKDSLKILSVTLDNQLSLEQHVEESVSKVNAKIGALRRIRKFISEQVALKLYIAYVLPQLEYCSPILLGISKSLAKKLESTH